MRNLLQELSFKPYNVTRLIGAAQFQFERKPSGYDLPIEEWNTDFSSKKDIEDSIKEFNYIQSLPVRSKYKLSLCSDDIYFENGFDNPIFQQVTNSYSKKLTTRELEALRKQYPKPKPEYWKGGRGSSNTKVLSSKTIQLFNPNNKYHQDLPYCLANAKQLRYQSLMIHLLFISNLQTLRMKHFANTSRTDSRAKNNS